jgi:amino-acid N-acetyltransferase
MILIRKAKIGDVPEIQKVITVYAKKGRMLFRKHEAIVQDLRDYYVAQDSRTKEIVGSIALHIYSDRLSEIKALAVTKDYHGKGIAKRMIKKCLQEAKDLGLGKVFVLTYVDQLFKKLKFIPANKQQLPEKIWKECSVCEKALKCDEICLVYQF